MVDQVELRWQPIETAPKDGSEVLVCREGKRYIARWASVWHPDNKMWVADIPRSDPATVASLGPQYADPWHEAGPTHWMPLPDPPHPNNTGEV